jgi:hypothetical protein
MPSSSPSRRYALVLPSSHVAGVYMWPTMRRAFCFRCFARCKGFFRRSLRCVGLFAFGALLGAKAFSTEPIRYRAFSNSGCFARCKGFSTLSGGFVSDEGFSTKG